MKAYRQSKLALILFTKILANKLNEKNYSLISKLNAEEFQKTFLELGYLKLMRVVTVTDEKFMALNWTQTGIQFWKDLTPITMEK